MKVLIIEDDKILSNTVKQCIEKKFNVEQAFDGEEGVLYAKQNIYDVIILDLMLPIMDGYDVLASLRKEKIYTPVLILTAKDGVQNKVRGFNLGADDYLVKPFDREELIARLESMVRRTNGTYINNTIEFKNLKLNLQTRQAIVNDIILNLQGKQFDVLEYLINYKNTIITKDQIFDKIWGFNSDTTTNVVEVYTSGLRKELKRVGYEDYLKTIRGVGYIWSDNEK